MADFGKLLFISKEDDNLDVKFVYFKKHGIRRLFMFGLDHVNRLYCRVICDLNKDDRIKDNEAPYEGIKARGDLIFVRYNDSHGVFDWDGNAIARFSTSNEIEHYMEIYERGYATGIEHGRSIALDDQIRRCNGNVNTER